LRGRWWRSVKDRAGGCGRLELLQETSNGDGRLWRWLVLGSNNIPPGLGGPELVEEGRDGGSILKENEQGTGRGGLFTYIDVRETHGRQPAKAPECGKDGW